MSSSFLPLTVYSTALTTIGRQKKERICRCDFIVVQKTTGAKQVHYSRGRQSDRMKPGLVAHFESTPGRKWMSIYGLSCWQLILWTWNSVTGERHEQWQLRLAGHANLHFTPKHMSRWGLLPFGCTSLFLFPQPDLPARLSRLTLSLARHPSVHLFVCHPPSISYQCTSLKLHLRTLIFSHPFGLLFLP